MDWMTLGLLFLGAYLLLRKKQVVQPLPGIERRAILQKTLGIYPTLNIDASTPTMVGSGDFGRSTFTTTVTLRWENSIQGDVINITADNRSLKIITPTPGKGSQTVTVTFEAYAGTQVRLIALLRNVLGVESSRASAETTISTGANGKIWV